MANLGDSRAVICRQQAGSDEGLMSDPGSVVLSGLMGIMID